MDFLISPQTSLKWRVQVDDIKVVDIGFDYIVNFTTKEFTMPMPILHGAPTEYIFTEWCETEDLKPIPSYIGHQCIQMEANILADWNIDALLPKTVQTPLPLTVHTHVTLNDKFVMPS